jgi:hypothetical protein
MIKVQTSLDLFFARYYYKYKKGVVAMMNEKKSSLILSFFVGGLIGGGITFLLTSSLIRKRIARPGRSTKKLRFSDEIQEQSYEDGVYCAPEGADMHYDMGKDTYYCNEE